MSINSALISLFIIGSPDLVPEHSIAPFATMLPFAAAGTW